MIYHFEFDIEAVFLTLFITYYTIFKKGLVRHANRVCLVLILLNFLSEFSDIMSSIANNNPDVSERVFRISGTISIFPHTM